MFKDPSKLYGHSAHRYREPCPAEDDVLEPREPGARSALFHPHRHAAGGARWDWRNNVNAAYMRANLAHSVGMVSVARY